MPDILVIGGGIAALTLAGRLNAAGIAVTIVERSTDFSAGGYVVGLYKNGFDIIKQLGGGEQAINAGWLPAFQLLTDDCGRQLRYTDLAALHEKHGAALCFYPRANLHALLRGLLADDNDIVLGASVCSLQEHAQGVDVVFTDGKEKTYAAVIGADGVASQTRQLLFGDAGQITHNGLFYYAMVQTASLSEQMRCEISAGDIEMLGQRGFFGIYPVSTAQCGIYAALYGDSQIMAVDARQSLRQHFSSYTPYAQVMLEHIDGGVFVDQLREVDFSGWGTARCFLIGDAAHALLPTSGQGVSLAMEDGMLLADILQQPPVQWRQAFAGFEAARQARIKPIRRSARLRNAAIARTPPLLCGLRNRAIKTLFGGSKARQLDSFFQRVST